MKFSEYLEEAKHWKVDFKNLAAATKGRQYELDGELVDIVDFVKVNTADDVESLSAKEIDAIVKLAKGKGMMFGGGGVAAAELRRVK